ncbi:AAA family ATPase [Aquitalea aquatilis]|uniref:AAA family ATPase n=1 Tax=Aquitalea aquatilis TaxID=1537400 RepID=UPI00143D276A|nr:AAA family ATPase [Aquitalea aquatilis]
MIIAIANTKGGCCKTTTAVNLAAELERRKHLTVLHDADPQETAYKWALRRLALRPCATHLIAVCEAANVLKSATQWASNTVVIIDAGGWDSPQMREAMAAADIMIIPMQPSQPDLEALESLTSIIADAKRSINPGLLSAILLTRTPTSPQNRETADARAALADFGLIPVLRSQIRDRPLYRHLFADGLAVADTRAAKASAARAEIQLLADEILAMQ